jgi:hypothetical protein
MRRNLQLAAAGLAAVLIAGATVALVSYELRSKGIAKTAASVRLTELPAPPPAAACPSGRAPDGPDNFHVSQDMNGYLSGCFRLGNTQPGEYTVSLQMPYFKPVGTTPERPGLPFSLSPASGPPGSTVTLSGKLAGGPSAQTAANDYSVQHASICIDCPNLEESVDVSWSSAGQFSIKVHLPAVPWMGQAGPVPLKAGVITLGIQCLGPAESNDPGCRGRIQGKATFTVTQPTPAACLANHPCTSLRVSPVSARSGDLVTVAGWAPLTEIIGTPFGYYLHLSPGRLAPSPSSIAKAPGSVINFLAPTSFTMLPGQEWASLGATQLTNVQPSGDAPIATDQSNPQHLAYCSRSGIAVTLNAGQSWSTISLKAAVSVARTIGFEPPNAAAPSCFTVTLDPRHPASLFARFEAQKTGQGIPPIYFIGLVSPDAGASWRPVPVPAGQTPEDFGGFRYEDGAIKAVFGGAGEFQGPAFPFLEATTDGGRSWATSTPSCPANGPCVTFTGVWDYNCAKFPAAEVIAYSSDKGKSWSSPQWPQWLDACSSDELVATADGRSLAISGRDEFHVLVSGDGGATWSAVLLPVTQGDASYEMFNDLQMLPNGSLLGMPGNAWFILPVGAKGWCPVSGPLAGFTPGGRTQVIGNRLWWLTQEGKAQSIPVSSVVATSCN